MLELFLKLIDRFIDLARRRQDVNREAFVDFVAPAMIDLEAVHADYLESFRRYRALLEDESIPMMPEHPVMNAIHKDNLFSEGLRAKVLELRKFATDPVMGSFMHRIERYVSGAATAPEYIEYESLFPAVPSRQARRARYRASLDSILRSNESDARKRALALHALDVSVRSLQRAYGQVVHQFTHLKSRLLKPV